MVFNPRFPNVFFLSQNIQCCHRESNGDNENKWVNSTYALKIFESFLESSKEEDCVTNVCYVNFQKLLHTLFLINIYLFNFTNIIGRAFCWMYLVSQTQKWYFADTTFFMHLTWEVLDVLNLAVKSNKWNPHWGKDSLTKLRIFLV